MNSYNLTFITDADIYLHVKNTVNIYLESIKSLNLNSYDFNKNIIDPIKFTFDLQALHGGDLKAALNLEILRQIDKSHANAIGYFNQNIFQYIGCGWECPKQGWDLINNEKKYFVEIKNKHNTMNSNSEKRVYERCLEQIENDSDSTCFLVQVISKKSQNSSWKGNPQVRIVSIDKFYELVTDNPYSFRDLCSQLPVIIKDVIEDETNHNVELQPNINSSSQLDQQILEIQTDLGLSISEQLKNIYLLAFEDYAGFGSFTLE
jgi:hypothetical protein